MTTFSSAASVQMRSERGIALIVVLLLLAVMSGLATGLTVNSSVEIAMATNEKYYAGARAAAEAGANIARAALASDTATNLLAGADGLVDAANPASADNADNGQIDFLLTGGPTYAIGNEYSYTIRILDDDDPSLYSTPLTAAQLDLMGGPGVAAEDGTGYIDTNDRLLLQVTGSGPRGTVVRIMRVVSSQETLTPAPLLPPSNPAILVDGNLTISGSPNITGDNGSVHANGNLTIAGTSTVISQNATASGTLSANSGWSPGGYAGGGEPTVTVPTVNAADFKFLATHILKANGQLTDAAGVELCNANVGNVCKNTYGWEMSSGTWVVSGNSVTSGTFYVEGSGGARVSGNPDADGPGGTNDPLAFSIIAEGSIEISGNPAFKPANDPKYQFITNGDLKLAGNATIDPITFEGQSLVRNQLLISGNPEVRGRIVVKNLPTVSPIQNLVDASTISGNPDITYNGTLDGFAPPPLPPTTTYTNTVIGWIES